MAKFVNISHIKKTSRLINVEYIEEIMQSGVKTNPTAHDDEKTKWAPVEGGFFETLPYQEARKVYGDNIEAHDPKLTTLRLKDVPKTITIRLPFAELMRRMREELLVI